ncbi:MAG: sec-independent protein translocase protein TatB [Pseudorhodobacter sp.]|jgi:sec-independent protein translocase protein TatB
MFDIGWTELLLIGIVALIVIGPKDLPEMFRTLGRFTAKARGMAREFSRAMETAADESGVKDVAKDLKNVTSAKNMGLDAVKNAASKFENWDPMKPKAEAAKGPATQALADAQAAKRSELLAASPKAAAVPEPATAAKPSLEKPATAKKAPAAKAAAKPAAVAKPAAAAKPASAAKPAAKKPAAKKPTVKKSDA